MIKAFNIALEKGISMYDALYIALAVDKKMPLLTLDRKQKNVASKLKYLLTLKTVIT